MTLMFGKFCNLVSLCSELLQCGVWSRYVWRHRPTEDFPRNTPTYLPHSLAYTRPIIRQNWYLIDQLRYWIVPQDHPLKHQTFDWQFSKSQGGYLGSLLGIAIGWKVSKIQFFRGWIIPPTFQCPMTKWFSKPHGSGFSCHTIFCSPEKLLL